MDYHIHVYVGQKPLNDNINLQSNSLPIDTETKNLEQY